MAQPYSVSTLSIDSYFASISWQRKALPITVPCTASNPRLVLNCYSSKQLWGLSKCQLPSGWLQWPTCFSNTFGFAQWRVKRDDWPVLSEPHRHPGKVSPLKKGSNGIYNTFFNQCFGKKIP